MEAQRSTDVVKDREEALLHSDQAVRLNPYTGLEIAALLHSSFGDVSLASAFVSRYEASYGTLRSPGMLFALINLGRAQEVVALVGDDPRPFMEDVALGNALELIGDLEMRVEVLSEHVAKLEGVIDVMLQEAENGTLEQAAAEIRAALAGSEE